MAAVTGLANPKLIHKFEPGPIEPLVFFGTKGQPDFNVLINIECFCQSRDCVQTFKWVETIKDLRIVICFIDFLAGIPIRSVFKTACEVASLDKVKGNGSCNQITAYFVDMRPIIRPIDLICTWVNN